MELYKINLKFPSTPQHSGSRLMARASGLVVKGAWLMAKTNFLPSFWPFEFLELGKIDVRIPNIELAIPIRPTKVGYEVWRWREGKGERSSPPRGKRGNSAP